VEIITHDTGYCDNEDLNFAARIAVELDVTRQCPISARRILCMRLNFSLPHVLR
jgi:hypothetical protein